MRLPIGSKIAAPVLIVKADAPPEIRKSNEEAAKLIQHGKLVDIDGAAHNLHHDHRKRTADELVLAPPARYSSHAARPVAQPLIGEESFQFGYQLS